MIAKAVAALRTGELEAAEPAVNDAVRALDKAATKNVVHRNNSARKKSRLMAKLNSLKAA
jgi:small subunit ribosomal protein S20